MEASYFPTPAGFRAWLEENSGSHSEVLVKFYKKATGKPTMTWSESVDQALCFGWIDGVRTSGDAGSYVIRFTPRRKASNWSAVNIRKVEELTAQGLMRPAGLAAFERRSEARSNVYSYEQRHLAKLSAEQDALFRANREAWDWFNSQAPSYRTTAVHWVANAKREETKAKRLATLIDDSAAGLRIASQRRN